MHVHVPDGVFPAWLWISSALVLIPLIVAAVLIVRKDTKRFVISSAVTALLLIVFSLELFGYHLDFTVLSGIILGPFWSLLSIATANIFLALFGHGGITVAPINIILNWIEALTGYLVFNAFLKRSHNILFKSAFSGLSVLLATVLSFSLFIVIVAVSGINPSQMLESGPTSELQLQSFILLASVPTILGGVVEAFATGLTVRFIIKTKPSLIS